MYVYIQSEFAGKDGATGNLWTVGFYKPNGQWHSESDHSTKSEAAKRVNFLNGGSVSYGVAP